MNPRRVLALAQKEWREIRRDPTFLSLAFLMPTVLMLVFGHGINQDVKHVPLVVVDYDGTETSRDYAERFAHSEYFDFRGYAPRERDATELLAHAAVRAVLIIPERFRERVIHGERAEVQTLIDGSCTTTRVPRVLEGYVEAINVAANTELRAGYLARRLGMSHDRALTALHPVEVDVRYLYDPELRSDWSVAPSLLTFVLIFVAPMLMSLSVVREKEMGSIFNVYASTLRRSEFLAGKLLPNVMISSVNAGILWLLAVFHFGAPFKGSLACFAFGSLLYVLATTGFGLVVSLLVSTQQAALIIVGVLASILGFQYSGMFTPISSLSGVPWGIAHAFPPMYYLEIVQGTFLKGLGFGGLWSAILPLSGFAAGYVVLAHALFHKRTNA